MHSFFQQPTSKSGKPLQEAGTPSIPRDVEHLTKVKDMGTRCPKNVNSIKLICTTARQWWHYFTKNLLQGKLTHEPWVYGDQIRGVYNIWGHCFLLDLVLLQDPAFTSETCYVPFHCHSSALRMWRQWGWLPTEDRKRGKLLLPQHTPPKFRWTTPVKGVKGRHWPLQ